jgi:2'-5' RNA ligase
MAEATEHWRLFVALPVPESVRGAIAAGQDELRQKLAPGSVRWTPADQLHLTLRFLGEVDAGRVTDLTNDLQTACAPLPAFDLVASGLDFFPHAQKPRVLWVGVADAGAALLNLWAAALAATNPYAAEVPESQYVGHITIGRVKYLQPADRSALAAQPGRMGRHEFGRWTADYAVLMRSQLSASGARHTVLARCPFSLTRRL